MHLCCSWVHCWNAYLCVICILFECISALSNGCNSSMWTSSNKYLKCSVEKSHFRVQQFHRSCSSGQLWNIRPCKACLFNQFPYFQLPTLMLCMLLFFCTKYIKLVLGRTKMGTIKVAADKLMRFTLMYNVSLWLCGDSFFLFTFWV